MKEYVEIHNFGPITEMVIDNVKPFTVFIGKSATGKSTIMKVIALFRYIFKLANIRSYFHLSKISRSPFRIDFRGLVRENGLEGMIDHSTKVIYTVISDTGKEYTIEYSSKKLHKLPDVDVEDLVFLKGVFVSENRNAISSWLGNSLERRGLKMGYYFEETLNLFLDSTSSLKQTDIPPLGVHFSASKSSNGGWQYVLEAENRHGKSFKLREASSGMKSTVPLALIVKYMAQDFNFKEAYRRSVLDYLLKADRLVDFQPATQLEGFAPVISIHVEEPELSLDPASQIELQEYIVAELFHKASPDRQCKLMYATHSPYLANHINLLMAKWEKDPATGMNPDCIDVFLTEPDGTMRSVMVSDASGHRIVDSEFLSQEIENLYVEYAGLRNK